MTDVQMNRLRMYRKVQGFSNASDELFTRYPAIGKSFKTFGSLLKKLERVTQVQAGSVTTNAKTKLEVKDEMAQQAVELAAAGYAYAKETNNTDLMSVLDVSYSEIRYADEQSAYSMTMAVHSGLEAELKNLENYLISQEDLDALQLSAEAFKERLENTASQDSVARTKQLTILFKNTSDHLRNHQDKLMMRVKRKEPVLYDAYVNARVIVDLGGSKKQISTELMEA